MIKKCGIIYFDTTDKKYLLVYGKKSGKWGFPKGHQENNETEEDTAIRELYEETGIKINQSNLTNKLRFKNNIYFNVITNEKPPIKIQDTYEILKVAWFSFYEILCIPKDNLNFGLKSWLNHFTDIQSNLKMPRFINFENFNSNIYKIS
jgi:tRNA nucleotidyltransferase (CCA-adding enzyme)